MLKSYSTNLYRSMQGRNAQKMLHGKTQNANESFNAIIWNRVHKANHVGLNTLSLGVYDAISHYIYGQKASLDTIKLLGIDPGVYMKRSCNIVNKKRKSRSTYKASSPAKKRRKILRHAHTKNQYKRGYALHFVRKRNSFKKNILSNFFKYPDVYPVFIRFLKTMIDFNGINFRGDYILRISLSA